MNAISPDFPLAVNESLRYFTGAIKKIALLFNADQTTGLPSKFMKRVCHTPQKHQPNKEIERLVAKYQASTGLSIAVEGSAALYRPHLDCIWIPGLEDFNTPEDYYLTLFHEIGHATGAKFRLDRSLNAMQEEMVADLVAIMLATSLDFNQEAILSTVAHIRHCMPRYPWTTELLEESLILAQSACSSVGVSSLSGDYLLTLLRRIETP
jgi:antirestriction protein ArdC